VKVFLRKICSPLLNIFESGDEPYTYKKSHRTILNVVGGLFLFLTAAVSGAGYVFSQAGAVLPGFIFFAVGLTCIVVGVLGTDRAVAKLWGNKP